MHVVVEEHLLLCKGEQARATLSERLFQQGASREEDAPIDGKYGWRKAGLVMIASLASGGTRSTNSGAGARTESLLPAWAGRRLADACENSCWPSALPGCAGGGPRSSSVTRDEEANGSSVADALSRRLTPFDGPAEAGGDGSVATWPSAHRHGRLAALHRLQTGVCSSHCEEEGCGCQQASN